jgi:hypothetical protein
MAHDVFISHAYKDKGIAIAICEKLESARVKCWIAERDISVGEDWTLTTRNAIGSSRVMVLLFSENANAAPHLEREIAHAFYTKRPILPVRLTETPAKRDFLFYLGNVRWIDAFASPPDRYLDELVSRINGILHGHTITREIKVPQNIANEARKALQHSDSWMGALRASHYGALEFLKRITIGASLLAAIWLLWFFYLQIKHGPSLPEGDLQTMHAPRDLAQSATPNGTPNSSASKTNYAYTRLGLWLPESAPSASTSPSPHPNLEQNPVDEKKSSEVGDDASIKSVPQHSPGIADQTPTSAAEPSPTGTNEAAAPVATPGKTPETNQSPAAVPLSSPFIASSVEKTPPEVQSGGSVNASPEQQSLQELVLEYLRAVANNDGATQERLFAGRVSFYGEGVLTFPEIERSMDNYRREWPIRKWVPKGEPEFPKELHSSDPNLYEVIQPFDWSVANGSKHKEGSAILYVRIRKAGNGAFHIFHLEQRHL